MPTNNIAATIDGGATETVPAHDAFPAGYRSCVAVWRKTVQDVILVNVGPNGTDLSSDWGRTWTTDRTG